MKKKKAIQTTWSDNDDSSIDDEDIVGEPVVHDKKLKFKNFDHQRSKLLDVSPPYDLRILPYKSIKTSSVRSSDQESISEAKVVMMMMLSLEQ